LYLICIVSISDCISSVQCQTFFFVILFDWKSFAFVLEHRSLLIVFRSIGSLLQLCLSIWSLLLILAVSICNQILHFSELSLEVQEGQDYLRFVEGTCIIDLCLSSFSLSLSLSLSLSVFIRCKLVLNITSEVVVKLIMISVFQLRRKQRKT